MSQEPLQEVRWVCKSWSEMDREELYRLLQLRSEVFVVEQECVYQDLDDKDNLGWHLWMERADAPAAEGGPMLACTRLLPAGVSYGSEVSIGRVATAMAIRREGWGQELMRQSLDAIHAMWPGVPLRISAQCYLERFYAGFGFTVDGASYLEDGIPHVAMTRPAGPA